MCAADQTLVRVGGWLFARRTWLPVPLVLVLLIVPTPLDVVSLGSGAVVVAAGELMRLWGVRHIGAISRTRSDRLGPLVSTGPFGWIRNPLYVGNVALWVGFTVSAGLVWLAPLVLAAFGLQYHAIVRWEEQLLAARQGDRYREYAARVPRWWPRMRRAAHPRQAAPPSFSWRATLFSERGTLLAIAGGYLLLAAKSRL